MTSLRKNNNRAKKDVEVKVEEVEAVEVKPVETAEEPKAKKEQKDDEISVIDNAIANSNKVQVAPTTVKAEPNVRVNPKQDINTYFGDQWYNLKAGKQTSVPRAFKEKLQRAGLLNPL